MSLHIIRKKKCRKSKLITLKIKYRATGKLEMRKPVAFSLFYDLELVVSQIGN